MRLRLMVTNAMIPGDTFVVTYYNVQVETLDATDLDDDPDSEYARL